MEINDKIKEVSDRISKQLERDIEMFGSSYLEIGELSIKRVDPATITIKYPVNHKKDAKGCGKSFLVFYDDGHSNWDCDEVCGEDGEFCDECKSQEKLE